MLWHCRSVWLLAAWVAHSSARLVVPWSPRYTWDCGSGNLSRHTQPGTETCTIDNYIISHSKDEHFCQEDFNFLQHTHVQTYTCGRKRSVLKRTNATRKELRPLVVPVTYDRSNPYVITEYFICKLLCVLGMDNEFWYMYMELCTELRSPGSILKEGYHWLTALCIERSVEPVASYLHIGHKVQTVMHVDYLQCHVLYYPQS